MLWIIVAVGLMMVVVVSAWALCLVSERADRMMDELEAAQRRQAVRVKMWG